MRGVAQSTDGVLIHYEFQGQGAPALVFVHGWSCDQSYWKKQMSYFASHYTVVAIDLGGHGDSGLNRESWTMAAFGEDVVAVVEHLALNQVVLIGHSMGGPVIVEAARRMPSRIIGLVGADTFKNLQITRTREEVEAVIEPFRRDFVQATDAFVRGGMFVPASDAALVEAIVGDMASAPPAVAIGAAEKLFGHGAQVRAGLQEVHVPIVAINADHSRTNMEAAGRFGITVKVMSGVGHFLMIEDPQTFNRLLEDVVQEILAVKPLL